MDSVQNTLTLMAGIISKLNLKDEPLVVQTACSEQEIDQL